MLLYYVESFSPSGVPRYEANFSPVARGVLTGLHMVIPALCSKSFAYFSYDKLCHHLPCSPQCQENNESLLDPLVRNHCLDSTTKLSRPEA
jgi:hypothetical protein